MFELLERFSFYGEIFSRHQYLAFQQSFQKKETHYQFHVAFKQIKVVQYSRLFEFLSVSCSVYVKKFPRGFSPSNFINPRHVVELFISSSGEKFLFLVQVNLPHQGFNRKEKENIAKKTQIP